MTSLSQRSVPPHLREHIFRSYEPFLTEAVAKWPTESGYSVPVGVASATFLANFRNAIVSLINYNWPTTVDREKLLRIRNAREYIIRLGNDGAVWFQSPKSEIRTLSSTATTRLPQTATTSAQPPLAQSLVPWRDSTPQEITALCLLIDKGRITGPFIINEKVDDDLKEQLTTTYNVAIVHDEGKNLTTII